MKVGLNPISFRAEETQQNLQQLSTLVPTYQTAVVQTDTVETPVQNKKVEDFKTRLKDINWQKEYIPQAKIIHMKERNMIDGLEYEISPDGTVKEVGCWVQPTVILEKDKDAADLFKRRGEKPKTLKERGADVWKFFASANAFTQAIVKGLAYGVATGAAILAGSWLFNTLPKAFTKEGPKFAEILKHPIKHINKSGKVLASIGTVLVAGYHAVKGKLDANQRTANIDHKLKTGHRE